MSDKKYFPTASEYFQPLPDRITQADIDKNYWRLPLSLRHKINPEPVLTLEQKIEKQAKFARMNASIYPPQHRSVAAYQSYLRAAGRGPLAEGSSGAGSLPPLTNRGGNLQVRFQAPLLSSLQAKEKMKIIPLGKRGKYELVRIPRPDRSVTEKFAFVDWVNFTWKVGKHPLRLSSGHGAISDHDYVIAVSAELYGIFGFGVCRQRESGLNFYKFSYEMGDPMQSTAWGLVCIGGQQDSISVTIKGQGLMAAQPGWEMRLYQFLKSVPDSKITRIDLASDNFNPKETIDDYLSMYNAGLFVNGGRAPNVEQAGNWIKPNGKGRTLYIGGRTSGKLLRIYEKGLQLGNGFLEKHNYSRWLRVELELKNIDRIIPFDALIKPGQYLAGAYPALNGFHIEQERIETFKKTAETTLERVLETTRHQFGKHIWALTEFFGIDEAIKKLTADKEQLPKSLAAVIEFQSLRPESDFLHSQPITTLGGFI